VIERLLRLLERLLDVVYHKAYENRLRMLLNCASKQPKQPKQPFSLPSRKNVLLVFIEYIGIGCLRLL